MRYLLVGLSILFVAFFIFTDPKSVGDLSDELGLWWKEVNYEKSIFITGTKLVDRSEVEGVLPRQRSVWWWLFNRLEIEDLVSKHSMIDSVSVEPCSRLLLTKWACFEVGVNERKPAFVALVEGAAWLMGEEGGFIAPIPADVNQYVDRAQSVLGRLRIIKGISANSSPQLVKARFQYVNKALSIVERELGRLAEWAELKNNAELVIKFRDLKLEAVFEFAADDWRILIEEAKRLARLLQEFKGKEQSIQRVDLAFNKVAVVKLF